MQLRSLVPLCHPAPSLPDIVHSGSVHEYTHPVLFLIECAASGRATTVHGPPLRLPGARTRRARARVPNSMRSLAHPLVFLWCVLACTCACACVRLCACACVCACVRAGGGGGGGARPRCPWSLGNAPLARGPRRRLHTCRAACLVQETAGGWAAVDVAAHDGGRGGGCRCRCCCCGHPSR